MTAWAARYSATDEPELTIWRDGVEFDRIGDFLMLSRFLAFDCPCGRGQKPTPYLSIALDHDTDLRADIAARVPVRECEETQACTRHAMPDGRCREHGGRDPL